MPVVIEELAGEIAPDEPGGRSPGRERTDADAPAPTFRLDERMRASLRRQLRRAERLSDR
jgi:hypothetical protein